MRIILVEGLNRVLPSMSERSGERAEKYLRKMGVEICLNSLISDYDGKTVRIKDGTEIESRTVVWAAGVKGNIPDGFAEESMHKGQLAVNEMNQVYRNIETGEVFPCLFAIGDAAFMKKGNGSLPGLAQVAIQQGVHLAENLGRLRKNRQMKVFRYRNKGVLATIGRNKAVADLPRGIYLSGWPGWFVWIVVHLYFLIGFRNKAVVFANWIWNYFTYDRGIRLIIRPSPKSKDPISHGMLEEMKEEG